MKATVIADVFAEKKTYIDIIVIVIIIISSYTTCILSTFWSTVQHQWIEGIGRILLGFVSPPHNMIDETQMKQSTSEV